MVLKKPNRAWAKFFLFFSSISALKLIRSDKHPLLLTLYMYLAVAINYK